MLSKSHVLAAVALLLAAPPRAARPDPGGAVPAGASAAERIVAAIPSPDLRHLAGEVLESNPELAESREKARAARSRGARVRALPDPVASLTGFLQSPETRTGPQRLMAGLTQGIPAAGKRGLRKQQAELAAAAHEAAVEARELELVTEARTVFYDLVFLDRQREILRELREHLVQHEEIARARYSTGVGLGQAVVKLHAEITRVEGELLEVEARRRTLVARLNGLRGRAADAALPATALPPVREAAVEVESLRGAAPRHRPEVEAADAAIARAEVAMRLAEKDYRPDFVVGLTYTLIDPRDDAAGRLMPPEGNGDDVLGIQGGIALPLWRRGRAAGVEEASRMQAAAGAAKRKVLSAIETDIGDLSQRVPLVWRQLRLIEDLLLVQAGESLESAQAGYIAGTLNALDLLDAEHVLFDAQTSLARARADYRIGLARLEGAVGLPLPAAGPETRGGS